MTRSLASCCCCRSPGWCRARFATTCLLLPVDFVHSILLLHRHELDLGQLIGLPARFEKPHLAAGNGHYHVPFARFSTPSNIPPEMLPFIFLNPIAGIISIYRSIVMDGILPKADLFWSTTGISFCVFLLGYFWFMHTKKGFSDVLWINPPVITIENIANCTCCITNPRTG